MKRSESQITTDKLTQTLNKRYGMKRLSEEFKRSDQYSFPFSLAMIDIDNFKDLNESYSTQCGDFVLKTLAKFVRQNIRGSDFISRYGGEEFLVMFSGADGKDGAKAVDRIRCGIEALKINFKSHELGLTISGGVAGFPSPRVKDAPSMVRIADDALNKAKKEGKNKVVLGQ